MVSMKARTSKPSPFVPPRRHHEIEISPGGSETLVPHPLTGRHGATPDKPHHFPPNPSRP